MKNEQPESKFSLRRSKAHSPTETAKATDGPQAVIEDPSRKWERDQWITALRK